MTRNAPHLVGAVARRYFRYSYHPNNSRLQYLRWAITVPFRSRAGGAAIARQARGSVPDVWARDLTGARTLVIGSGPSLDKVDDAFFAGFDTVLYVNFALARSRGANNEYFFTTDSGPVREFIDSRGVEPFVRLGSEHCIFAPIFLDQWQGFTDEGRALFTWIACDAAKWRVETRRVGWLTVPFALRYSPRQPDWDAFQMPPAGRRLPVMDHTSALSAVMFAAVNGAREIGLIGCDFSGGRAAIVGDAQPDPGNVFTGAADEFIRMAAALARNGVIATNHSWTV